MARKSSGQTAPAGQEAQARAPKAPEVEAPRKRSIMSDVFGKKSLLAIDLQLERGTPYFSGEALAVAIEASPGQPLPDRVDEQRRTLFLPEPKGGAERAFYLPLTEAMFGCIYRAREAWLAPYGRNERHAPSPLLFPSSHSSSGKIEDMRAQYRDATGRTRSVKSGHDLRRSFKNMARAAGVPNEVAAVLMNHLLPGQTAAYENPGAVIEFYREAMEKISTVVMQSLGAPADER